MSTATLSSAERVLDFRFRGGGCGGVLVGENSRSRQPRQSDVDVGYRRLELDDRAELGNNVGYLYGENRGVYINYQFQRIFVDVRLLYLGEVKRICDARRDFRRLFRAEQRESELVAYGYGRFGIVLVAVDWRFRRPFRARLRPRALSD